MDTTNIMTAMMALPLIAGIVLAILPKSLPRTAFEIIHFVVSLLTLVFGLCLVIPVLTTGQSAVIFEGWFRADALGAIFAGIVCVVQFLTGLALIPHFRGLADKFEITRAQVKRLYCLFNLFVFVMLFVVLTDNIIMMWVGIEASTLVTVFLIAAFDTKKTLEGAWKYMIVCTCGVAFGMFGTLLFYANAATVMGNPHDASFWSAILSSAGQFDKGLVQLAFVFAAVGFGTKAGLFPMHTWMPDAYQQAPSPVSGLLSGALAKCAMLVIIRFYVLAVQAIGPGFPQMIMLVLGALSIAYSVWAVLRTSDIKRKFAFSSCENIGIVGLCLGFGGPLGIVAALLHCVFHSLAKSLALTVCGNVELKYGTTDLKKISGIIYVAPATAVLMGFALFTLAGFPPFALFFSEVMMAISGFMSGYLWLVIVLAICLTVVIAAFALVFLRNVLGKAPAPSMVKKGEVSPLMIIPEAILVVLILWFGIALPAPVAQGVSSATNIVLQDEALDSADCTNLMNLYNSAKEADDAAKLADEAAQQAEEAVQLIDEAAEQVYEVAE